MNFIRWFKKECAIRKADRFVRHGNTQKALEKIDEALKYCPRGVDLYIQKAWALGDLKRYEDAKKMIGLGLELNPQNGILHMLYGEILYAEKDYEGAKKAYLKALEQASENLRIEYGLGLVYVALGDMDKAAQYFESSIKYDKNLVKSRLLAMAERYLFEHKRKSQ